MAEVDDGLIGHVESEIIKAGPDGISKAQLQQATGLGADDLRDALRRLEAGDVGQGGAARIAEHAGGYVHVQYAGEGAGEGALPIPPAAEAAASNGPEPEPAPAPGGAEEAADGLSGFRITWETTVEYRSKTPETAVQDGKTIIQDAQQGILSKSPSLGISQQGLVVTQFAERRIWPPQQG